MNLRLWDAFVAMPAKAKLALYTAIGFALLLVLVGEGYAATPNEGLKGTYVFQITSTKEAFWSNSVKCGKNTYWASNWSAYTQLAYGVATFDGAGHVAAFTLTQTNHVNQTASNETISMACSSNGGYTSTGGNLVFDAPQSATATATYAVESSGSGTLTITVPSSNEDSGGSITFNLSLAGFGSNGVATMVLMNSQETENNKDVNTGIALLK